MNPTSIRCGRCHHEWTADPEGFNDCSNCGTSWTFALVASPEEPEDEDYDPTEPLLVHGTLAPFGVETGDRRAFTPGSLRQAEMPMPLMWQEALGSGHDGAVITGQITEVWTTEDGSLLNFQGIVSEVSDEADKMVGLMAEFGRLSLSVDLDDVREVHMDEDSGVTVFSDARTRAATALAIGAFTEAYVALGPHPDLAKTAEAEAEAEDEPEHSSLIVAALPAGDEAVHQIGNEQKHATLLWLGDNVPEPTAMSVRSAVNELLASEEFIPWSYAVTDISELGEDDPPARVWKLDDAEGSLESFRSKLLRNETIKLLFSKNKQYPQFTPHVTIGYEEAPEEAYGVEKIRFDRLAVWWGDNQYEYSLEDGSETLVASGWCAPSEFQSISDKPWSGDASRFTIEQWKRSTLIDMGEGDPDSKSRYKLPILEPNGDLSRAAVHNATARINQTDAPADQIAKAKRALRGAYAKLDEEPPEVLQALGAIEQFKRGPGWVTHPRETSQLHRYWVRGPGAAKIKWGTPHDFYRCRRLVGAKIAENSPESLRFLNRICFGGETEYLTKDGVRTLAETVGTTQMVLTAKHPVGKDGKSAHAGGHWVEAEIKSFGEQELYEIVLKRGKHRKIIRATPEHRWFASKSSNSNRASQMMTTADLEPGMYLASVMPMPLAKRRSRPSPFGIAAGFVFGDGTKEANTASLHMFEHDQESMLRYFSDCRQVVTKTDQTVTALRITGMPKSWGDRPSLDEGFSYLYGWLAGYIAADGTVDKDGGLSLSSASRDDLEFASLVAMNLGITTLPIQHATRVGINAAEATDLYRMGFVGSTVPADLLVKKNHRERFESHEHSYGKVRWAVESVTATGEAEEVFCAVVPETEAFTLKDNIFTSNCAEWHHDATGLWPGQHDAHSVDALTASGVPAVPASWFSEPEGREFTITEDPKTGLKRVSGMVAQWRVCHIAYNQCVTPPKNHSGYRYFLTGRVPTDAGEQPVGALTYATGHASLKDSPQAAAEHYDNTGAAWAFVNVGENKEGIWFSGVVNPSLDDAVLWALKAGGAVSGDWRGIEGASELVGVLSVNTPGFPQPLVAAAFDGSEELLALTAAGIVVPENQGETMSEVLPEVVAEPAVEPVAETVEVEAESIEGEAEPVEDDSPNTEDAPSEVNLAERLDQIDARLDAMDRKARAQELREKAGI